MDGLRFTPDDVRLEEEMRRDIRNLFPFGLPSDELFAGTYFIRASEFQLDNGFHQTSSSTLVMPRNDGRLLIPAVALGNNHPGLDIRTMLRDGFPVTHQNGRRFAVWWRRNILNVDPFAVRTYTPERASYALASAAEIKDIYQKGLRNKVIDQDTLGKLVGEMIGGFWQRYYVRDLPQRIEGATGDETTEAEVEQLFSNLQRDLGLAGDVYSNLGENDRLLLDGGFNLIIQARMSTPSVYMDSDIPAYLSNSNSGSIQYFDENPPRSPFQIAGDPRGTFAREVENVYLPDEIEGSHVDNIARSKLAEIGIEPDRIRRFSSLFKTGIEVYDNCLKSYGDFGWPDLQVAIESRKFEKV